MLFVFCELFLFFVFCALLECNLPTFRYLDFVRCNMEIVKNFKFGLTTHFLGVHKTKMVVAKNIICALAFNQFFKNNKGVVKTLRFDR